MAGAHEHRGTLEQGQETAGRVETVPGKPATASGGAFFKETRDDFARDEGAGRCGPSAQQTGYEPTTGCEPREGAPCGEGGGRVGL